LRKTVFYEQPANQRLEMVPSFRRFGDVSLHFLLYFNASDKLARISNCGCDHVAMSRPESRDRIEGLPIVECERSRTLVAVRLLIRLIQTFLRSLNPSHKIDLFALSTHSIVCNVR
jgi:hypothetical protein